MNSLVLAIRVIGLFFVIYGISLMPLYISYYYASGNLTLKFFFLIVIMPYIITLAISFICMHKANNIAMLISRGSGLDEREGSSTNYSLILKYSVRLLCIYLLFVAISDIAYSVSYFIAVQDMINDGSYIDPEGLGKLISAFVELAVVIVISKWKLKG